MTAAFDLVLTGQTLPGHAREDVAKGLARIMKLSEETAALLLQGRETVVRRRLPEAQLPRYLEAMQRVGAQTRVQAADASSAEPPATASAAAEAAPPVRATAPAPSVAAEPVQLALVADAATAQTAAAPEETMKCPTCDAEQPRRTLCRECGADMPRVLAARAEAARERERPPQADAGDVWAPRASALEPGAPDECETPHPLGLSLSGRVGRLRYLAYAFPAYLPLALGGVLAAIIGGTGGPGFGMFVPLLLGGLITGWLGLRAMILRLHDLNRTGKWVLLVVALPVLAALARSPGIMIAFVVLILLASLALMLLPGSGGGNDYGAPPGPNTMWTVIGAVLMILLSVFGGIGGQGASWAGAMGGAGVAAGSETYGEEE